MVQPIKQFKVGACITSVFLNEVETESGQKIFRSVSLRRMYRDKEGRIGFAKGLKEEDVPHAIAALRKAQAFLLGEDQQTLDEEIL